MEAEKEVSLKVAATRLDKARNSLVAGHRRQQIHVHPAGDPGFAAGREYASEPGDTAGAGRRAGFLRSAPRPRRSRQSSVPDKWGPAPRGHHRLRTGAESALRPIDQPADRSAAGGIRPAHGRESSISRPRTGCSTTVADVDFYGGQRGTTQPSFEYGGSKGNFSYFVTGQYLGTDRGVEPPTPGTDGDSRHQQPGRGLRILLVLSESDDAAEPDLGNRDQSLSDCREPESAAGVPAGKACRSIRRRKSARTSSSRTTSTCWRCRERSARISITRSRRSAVTRRLLSIPITPAT